MSVLLVAFDKGNQNFNIESRDYTNIKVQCYYTVLHPSLKK
jgi:hypothetical protein